ncbi:MAG: DUF5050 domain-containing protein [Muribaculaceae bacterium]|nr:DUF5050 domain-containing protein [Muribaculaceae bacterium]
MLHFKKIAIAVAAVAVCFNADAKKPQEQEYVIEESGLNVTKITDEALNSVIGATTSSGWLAGRFASSMRGGCKKAKFLWGPYRTLAVSKDGSEIAYMTRKNKQDNIMIRRSTGAGASTQRTFRNVLDFCWGPDDNLYISDYVDNENVKIGSVDAHKGNIMRQLTSNNFDFNPATIDGKLIFFTRFDHNGPMIWSYNTETGELISCARGFQPTPISSDEFLCTRNSTDGNSEIWRVNYVNGQETLVVSNREQGYTNPTLSPDGQWILLQANSKSTSTKKQNLDIYVIRPDGTQLTQLTYHPADDFCPQWSADGRQIYFISSRGTKDRSFNIWKMNFSL